MSGRHRLTEHGTISSVPDTRLTNTKRPRRRGATEPIPPRDIIGNAEVRKLCGGITRHTLIRWREAREFPAPIRTLAGTPKTELWDARQVRAWIDARDGEQ